MENQMELFKGELMEEKLRLYFINNGYYVARGVKYNFEGDEITDIDLFLYGRTSSMTRERINVDIKNKNKSSKAFERILWAKGLQTLLKFDGCVVATTDKREVLRKYGLKHNTIILDGNFLQKLTYGTNIRVSEDSFLSELSKIKNFDTPGNSTWKNKYENSKSRILSELDFSGFNSALLDLKYFLLKCFDTQKKEIALRTSYIILSHSLIILDYILKDIAFLEPEARKENLSDGFKYGNLGKNGVDQTINMALQIAKSKISTQEIKKRLDTNEMDILKEYFSKNDTMRNIFKWALSFEQLGFQTATTFPNELPADLKGTLAIILDYFQISRKDYFDLY
ncbi:hypothetical protein B0A75_19485 [Flavobacterium oncorhynchi]|uniref:Uncharacterized protein n=2 Tax=Flavobacterium oncorhynchi TaxID=728056 RepID=A0A226HME0_9FLAO|nr:hypothetical protein B0A75_19485 [Flavobacterium oncorhynchi]